MHAPSRSGADRRGISAALHPGDGSRLKLRSAHRVRSNSQSEPSDEDLSQSLRDRDPNASGKHHRLFGAGRWTHVADGTRQERSQVLLERGELLVAGRCPTHHCLATAENGPLLCAPDSAHQRER